MTTTTDQPPGAGTCPECERATLQRPFTRRAMLKGLLAGTGAAAAGSTLVTMDTRVAYALDAGYAGDTLVVLSLRGGIDGLSLVAPVGDPDYATLRPSIAVPQAAAVALPGTTLFGLHPMMAPLLPMFTAGTFSAVHATGLPQPNRSHFSAMAEMEEATPGSVSRTGWLDRTLALHTSDGPFGAVQMGSTNMPTALVGPYPTLGMNSINSFTLSGTGNPSDRLRWGTALSTLFGEADPVTAGAANDTLAALNTAATLASTTYTPANGAVYPSGDLGDSLRDVVRLIKANVGIRVATIDLGNWDMHVGLGSVSNGWMHDKLIELSAGLLAFATDLGPLLNQTTLVTMSEFGRRAYENDSGGLDHGWGNVMLMVGGNLTPGVHGTWPTLSPATLQVSDGDVLATTDYRAVLADILYNRCGASSAAVQQVFPAFTGTTMGLTKPLA